MPRGPATPAQALWSVVLSVAAGVVAGRITGSRWSPLVAPAVFVVALELVRWNVPGPSVDLPHFSGYGVIVLIAGRGVHGLLSIVPMLLAAAYGAGLTRGSWWRRALLGAPSALVLALTVAVALPATTAPVRGPDGRPVPGSVAELTSVDAGGRRLGLMIRGDDTSLPVLLFVPGTPGGSEVGAMRRHLADLEHRFVVATLDRRGAGRSYAALDPASTVTLDGAVDDTVAVAEHLRQRFGQRRIVLVAHSGGSLIGVLAAQRRPDLFRAYVGAGQAVHLPTTDRIFYDDVLAWARGSGRAALVDRLVAQGPPPYPDFFSYEPIIDNESRVYAYDHTGNSEGEGGFAENLGVPEYALLDTLHTVNAIVDTWSLLYPRMQGVDLRTDVRRLDVPAYFVNGAHEMRGLGEPFAEWYAQLAAPRKELVVVAGGGHRALFERPADFVAVMTRVLAETSGS